MSTSSSSGKSAPGSQSEDDSQTAFSREDYRDTHHEIRAAKISVERTGHGVTMTISAGKLRLRLFIEAQWSDLIREISAGEGELDHLVPFRMAPFEVEETEVVSSRTIDARTIPGLSNDNPLQGTPLWNASFPPEDQEPPS